MKQDIKDALEEVCNEEIGKIRQGDYSGVVIHSSDLATRRYLSNLFLNDSYWFEEGVSLSVNDVSGFGKNETKDPKTHYVDLVACLAEKGISGRDVFKNSANP